MWLNHYKLMLMAQKTIGSGFISNIPVSRGFEPESGVGGSCEWLEGVLEESLAEKWLKAIGSAILQFVNYLICPPTEKLS